MTYYFSQLGLSKLEAQINTQSKLVTELGKQVGEEAGSGCDWHDNFGFEEARRRLELESRRLKDLSEIRMNANKIQLDQISSEKITIGCEVKFTIDNVEKKIFVGGYGESSAQLSLMSYDSPISQLVLGMKRGEFRDAFFKGQAVEIEVLEFEFAPKKYLDLLDRFYLLSQGS